MRLKKYILAILSVFPVTALAFSLSDSSFFDVASYVYETVMILVPILSGLAFIAFFWGLSKFILNSSGDQAGLKKGKDYMLWSILALFILVTFRAIVGMVSTELGIDNPVRPSLPSSNNASDETKFPLSLPQN